MRCPSCGIENPDSARFCGTCGSELTLTCTRCGSPVVSGNRFCNQCGAAVSVFSSETTLGVISVDAFPQTRAEVTERRFVSVLFADLVGFTSLSEHRDAEDVRDLLSQFSEVSRLVVERYGGKVENFIGDAVFAVWGSPTVHEDDAERAVRCGLELVEAISNLGADVNAPGLSARAGVLTGEAAVNYGPAGESMIAGDLINTASRLQTAAAERTVIVGEATYQAAKHAIAFADVGELNLKGKNEPVRAYRALRVVGQRKGVGRREGIEAPFVGRVEQLRALKESLDALDRERRARLISVTGIPGIGKSRLAWEFKKYVDGLADVVFWHEGRSPAYGDGVSFWALSEMVRMRCSISEDEDDAAASRKLSATLEEFVADEGERDWIEARLAYLLGLAEAPLGQAEETFSAWRKFFEHIAARARVVMVFEDLQWADPGLIDFIESILEWSRAHPILVVSLSRPELLERRPNWGAGQRNFLSLHLDPLSDQAMRDLLRGLVRDVPAGLEGQILERAEGVPLYAVEIVRMLVGKGLVVEVEGAYQAVGELSDLDVPDSLHALIASRLDSLLPGERALLQDAAVLGKSFPAAALASLTNRSIGDLEGPLRDLVRKELLSVDIDPRSPERGQYGFLQGLIREVAYTTLSRTDRRSKHLSAAHYFESLADDELSGVVAAHYLEAYRSSPDGPERAALGARARDTLADAGRRALTLGSPEQALSYFEQALDIVAVGAEQAELASLAGQAAERAGSYEQAVAHFERAIAYHENVRDDVAAGRVVALWTMAMSGLRRLAEAIDRAESAFAALSENDDARVRGDLAADLAMLNVESGEAVRAYEWIETALVIIEKLDEQELLARAFRTKGFVLFTLGRHQEAMSIGRAAVAIAEVIGSLREQGVGLTQLGLFGLDDDPRGFLDTMLRAVEVSRRAGDRSQETVALLNGVESAIFLGAWDVAGAVLAELDERELPGGWSWFRTLCHGLLRALRGDPVGGFSILGELDETGGSSEYIHQRATYLKGRSLVSLAAGKLNSAIEEAEAAVATDPSGANASSALAVMARAALWLGDTDKAASAVSGMRQFRGRWMAAIRIGVEAGLAALGGQIDEAIADFGRARRTLTALDAPLDLALLELDVAFLLEPRPEAVEAASKAERILTELGASALLVQLDERRPRESSNARGSINT